MLVAPFPSFEVIFEIGKLRYNWIPYVNHWPTIVFSFSIRFNFVSILVVHATEPDSDQFFWSVDHSLWFPVSISPD